jgi:hypothetical protein
MRRRRYWFLGEPPSAHPLLLACDTHGSGVVGWVSCAHVDRIVLARRNSQPVEGVAGEALCGACRALLDARHARLNEFLTFRCEPCVLDRWPLEGAN